MKMLRLMSQSSIAKTTTPLAIADSIALAILAVQVGYSYLPSIHKLAVRPSISVAIHSLL